jgi:SAM-dependent methyltransferase
MTDDLLLLATRQAFDRVAPNYDGALGNNYLIQRMRAELWETVTSSVPSGSRLLDLGCGTGIDAVYFASRGYEVLATDWSREMCARASERVERQELNHRVTVRELGIHQLNELKADKFDAVYSNLGALNCVLSTQELEADLDSLLNPGGRVVASVIGRFCPWEVGYYLAKRRPKEALRRSSWSPIGVSLSGGTVWTRYYSPPEFYRLLARQFRLVSYRSLSLFVPPPYLISLYDRLGLAKEVLTYLDQHLGWLPLLKSSGDHFLMVLEKRD